MSKKYELPSLWAVSSVSYKEYIHHHKNRQIRWKLVDISQQNTSRICNTFVPIIVFQTWKAMPCISMRALNFIEIYLCKLNIQLIFRNISPEKHANNILSHFYHIYHRQRKFCVTRDLRWNWLRYINYISYCLDWSAITFLPRNVYIQSLNIKWLA